MTYPSARQHSKPLKLGFPFHAYRRRLSKITQQIDIGTFAIDTVSIVTEPQILIEEFPCDSKGSYCVDGGYMHLFKFKDHTYEVFQGIDKVRPIFFSPRAFKTLSHLKEFVANVIGNRNYHFTRVDFAFYLSKRFFNVDFLFCSFWARGFSMNPEDVVYYDEPIHKIMNNSERQRFSVGLSPWRFQVYDCDVHNLDKKRSEEKKVNGMINFEVQLRTDALVLLGIESLDDLEVLSFSNILNHIEFLTPSSTCFKKTTLEAFAKQWKKNGLHATMKTLYDLSGWNNYDKIIAKMLPLAVGNKTMKEALIEMATIEHSRWIKGSCRIGRFGVQGARYPMSIRPLFDAASTATI